MRKAILLLCMALTLAACTPPTRLNATTYATLQSSLDAAQRQLFQKDRVVFQADRALFNAMYFPHGTAPIDPPGRPDWQAVEGMNASEFHEFVRTNALTHRDPLGSPSDFPNPGIAHRLLEQYQLEKTLSEAARDHVQASGKNTLDQYPLSDATMIPPPTDAPVELDFARFLVHFHNRSGYDAYHPVFHVQVIDPRDQAPLIDRTFDLKERAAPIDPGADEPIEMTCCGIASDPVNNHLLKTMPANVQFRIDLIDVRDHNNVSVLDTTGFDQHSVDRISVVDRCIRILSAHLRTWVPQAPGEPECGPDASDPSSETAQATQIREQALRPAPPISTPASTQDPPAVTTVPLSSR